MTKKVTDEQWAEAAKWIAGDGCEKLTQVQVAAKLGCSQGNVSRKFGKKREPKQPVQ